MTKRLMAATASVFVLVIVAGCSGSTGGEAGPTSPSVQITGPAGTATVPASENPIQQAELWDPCSLPQSVKDSIGLVNRTRNDDSVPPWRFCSYGLGTGPGPGDPDYGVNVGVSTYSFDQMKQNDKFNGIRPTSVGDHHPAFLADSKGPGDGINSAGLNIVWGTSYGSVTITLLPLGGSAPIDEGALLDTFVTAAYPYVPK